MASYSLTINGRRHTVDVDADTPVLWVLRDNIGLTGTKFGCGIGECGACTIHLGDRATRSCQLTVAEVGSTPITTIEALSPAAAAPTHAVQRAWIEEQVPQCGYCQSGQIMAAAALLAKNPRPSDADIDAAMTNICRCGTQSRIHKAVRRAAMAPGGRDE